MTQATGTTATQTTATQTTGSRAAGRSRGRQPHPVENSLSIFTLVAGLVSCVLGFLAYQDVSGAWTHVGATWLGLITLVVGLPAQLFSATRSERMLIVTGLVAAFVGVCLGLAHGGLLP